MPGSKVFFFRLYGQSEEKVDEFIERVRKPLSDAVISKHGMTKSMNPLVPTDPDKNWEVRAEFKTEDEADAVVSNTQVKALYEEYAVGEDAPKPEGTHLRKPGDPAWGGA